MNPVVDKTKLDEPGTHHLENKLEFSTFIVCEVSELSQSNVAMPVIA